MKISKTNKKGGVQLKVTALLPKDDGIDVLNATFISPDNMQIEALRLAMQGVEYNEPATTTYGYPYDVVYFRHPHSSREIRDAPFPCWNGVFSPSSGDVSELKRIIGGIQSKDGCIMDKDAKAFYEFLCNTDFDEYRKKLVAHHDAVDKWYKEYCAEQEAEKKALEQAVKEKECAEIKDGYAKWLKQMTATPVSTVKGEARFGTYVCGENSNVYLTAKEIDALVKTYGVIDTAMRIDALSCYRKTNNWHERINDYENVFTWEVSKKFSTDWEKRQDAKHALTSDNPLVKINGHLFTEHGFFPRYFCDRIIAGEPQVKGNNSDFILAGKGVIQAEDDDNPIINGRPLFKY